MAKSPNGGTRAQPGEKAPAAPLPPSLISALPVAKELVMHSDRIAALTKKLQTDMTAARRNGATALARAYVVFKRAVEKLEADLKPLDALFKSYKDELVPETLDDEGVTNVPLAEGFRVGTSLVFRASIREGKKTEAYAWLRKNKHADIIAEAVNASTLSSVAGELLKDHCLELPGDLFNVAIMNNTSVTSTK